MSGTNVIQLVRDAHNNLIPEADLPSPGSDAWVEAVLKNLSQYSGLDENLINIVLTSIPKDKLREFTRLLIGDLVSLMMTPANEYVQRGKIIFGAIPDDPATLKFTLDLIYDLCAYLEKPQDPTHRFVENLYQGQVYTFWSDVINSYAVFIQKYAGG